MTEKQLTKKLNDIEREVNIIKEELMEIQSTKQKSKKTKTKLVPPCPTCEWNNGRANGEVVCICEGCDRFNWKEYWESIGE